MRAASSVPDYQPMAKKGLVRKNVTWVEEAKLVEEKVGRGEGFLFVALYACEVGLMGM